MAAESEDSMEDELVCEDMKKEKTTKKVCGREIYTLALTFICIGCCVELVRLVKKHRNEGGVKVAKTQIARVQCTAT